MHATVAAGHCQVMHLQVGAGQHANRQRHCRLVDHRGDVEAEADVGSVVQRVVRVAFDGQGVDPRVRQRGGAVVVHALLPEQVVAVGIEQAPVGVAAAAAEHVEEIAVTRGAVESVQQGLVGRGQLAADGGARGDQSRRRQVQQPEAEVAHGGVGAVDHQCVLASAQVEAGVVEPGVVGIVAVAKNRHAISIQHAPDQAVAPTHRVEPQLGGCVQREAVALGVTRVGQGAGHHAAQRQGLSGVGGPPEREAVAGVTAGVVVALHRQQIAPAVRQQHAVEIVAKVVGTHHCACGQIDQPPIGVAHVALGRDSGKHPVTGHGVETVELGAVGWCQRASDAVAQADRLRLAHVDQVVGHRAQRKGVAGVGLVDREHVVAGRQRIA